MRIKGGLLGHWSVWVQERGRAARPRIHAAVEPAPVPADLLALDSQVTDCNAAIFDVANDFHGVICRLPRNPAPAGPAGRHLVPRSERNARARARSEEIDRVCAAYPHLNDDAFVRAESRALAGVIAHANWPLSLDCVSAGSERAVGGNRETLQRYSLAVVSHLLLVAAWYLFVELGNVPKFVMPSPHGTLKRCWFPTIAGSRTSRVTATEIFGGYILAVVVGIGIALLFSWFALARNVRSMPLLVSLNMIPKVALGPLIIVWFSYGIGPNMMMAFAICFFPIVLTTARGLREVEPDLLDLVRTLKGSRWQMFTKIQLPGALPYIFSGMKVAAILAVAGAIVGEFLGSDRGLGYLMLQVQVTLDTAAMFMAVILITLLGMAALSAWCSASSACSSCRTRGSDRARMAEPFIHLAGVKKVYRTRGAEFLAVSRGDVRRRGGRAGFAGRPVRLRQDHAAENPRRPALRTKPARCASASPAQPFDPSRDIGMVFQQPLLLKWRRIIDNVLLPAEILGLPMAQSRERARDLLALVGLKGAEDKYPYELSGGMQQRAAIARALIHDPKLILMDEPFGALDALTREKMNLELLRIWQEAKKTIVFVTHGITEAVFLGTRVDRAHRRPGAHGRQFPGRPAASAHARHEDAARSSANTRAASIACSAWNSGAAGMTRSTTGSSSARATTG